MATSKLVTVVLVLLLRISLFWDAALAVPSSITKPPFRQGSSPGPWPNLPEDVDDPALEKRQSTIAKVCDPATPGICWIEMYRSTALPRFRVAFPDTASPPFDALLQIISPVAVGWAGWCWGGRMVNNPLTIAWQNGQNVTVTSRWASARTVPTNYPQATLTTLSQFANSTHWTVEILCSGCSRWSGGQLLPNEYNGFAWALSTTKVTQPSNPNANFAIHTNVGNFNTQLRDGRVSSSVFQQYVRSKRGRR